jgi:hypothetical protein
MSIISQQNANLSLEEKRALLAQLLREKANESKSLFPLSPGQQALWFFYKLAPHSWAYNPHSAPSTVTRAAVAGGSKQLAELVSKNTQKLFWDRMIIEIMREGRLTLFPPVSP